MSIEFSDTDQRLLTLLIDSILKAVVMTEVTTEQARQAIAHLVLVAARGDERDLRDWFDPETIDVWKRQCVAARRGEAPGTIEQQ
jgi:hypothetical protein